MNTWRKKTKFCLPQSLRAQPPYGRTQARVTPCGRSKLSRELWWRGGKKKESLQLRLWNLNVCVEKVDTKCWLAEMTSVMTSLPWHVFFNVCLHLRSFPLCADWRKSNSSVDGGHRGIGVPETLLQGFLPFPSPPPECLGELAHRLPMVVDTEPHPHHNTKTNRINWGLWLTDHLPLP